MISSYDLETKFTKLIVFLLIFGNAIVGKPFSSIRIDFVYINEILLGTLFLLFYKKNVSFLYKILVLLTIPFIKYL